MLAAVMARGGLLVPLVVLLLLLPPPAGWVPVPSWYGRWLTGGAAAGLGWAGPLDRARQMDARQGKAGKVRYPPHPTSWAGLGWAGPPKAPWLPPRW